MRIKIVTLCENTVGIPGNLYAEWGLSLYIEVDEIKLLLDTGSTFVAVQNAEELKIDLSKVNKVIISHGHSDHTGGLKEVLKKTGRIEIVAHQDIFKARYFVSLDGRGRKIGIPFDQDELENLGVAFNFNSTISDKIMTTGEIPRVNAYETVEKTLRLKKNGQFIQDMIQDDQSLIIKTPQGLIIIPGCAHAGLVNTIMHAQKVSGEERILAIIGGSHLIVADIERINKTINFLKEINPEKISLGHCTGFMASKRLSEEFGLKFTNCYVGATFIFET